jgi:inhibitor of KinA
MIQHLSDSALIVSLGNEIDPAINQRVHGLKALLAAHPLEGVLEFVPAYASLTIHYDPLSINHSQISDWVARHIASAAINASRSPRTIEVPVIYDGADLESVAALCRLSVNQVVNLHTSVNYLVYMMGFTPGFPYMGNVPNAIQTPRLATPRAKVPAGSIAIASAQTGIYPIDSPGGWRLIGRTALTLFDPNADDPFLFAPGDVVKFIQTG